MLELMAHGGSSSHPSPTYKNTQSKLLNLQKQL